MIIDNYGLPDITQLECLANKLFGDYGTAKPEAEVATQNIPVTSPITEAWAKVCPMPRSFTIIP